MDAIDKMYLKEKHFNLKYYDTLKLAELLFLTFLYSYSKSSTDVIKELGLTKKQYPESEQQEMLGNAILILKFKFNVEMIQDNPLIFKKIEKKNYV